MTTGKGNEPAPELPSTEQSRIRHRDRKRETRMVVDNAGVKRVVPAVRRRRRSDDTPGASRVLKNPLPR